VSEKVEKLSARKIIYTLLWKCHCNYVLNDSMWSIARRRWWQKVHSYIEHIR